jgi:hypothetical protein
MIDATEAWQRLQKLSASETACSPVVMTMADVTIK